jgi:hypothetical protein
MIDGLLSALPIFGITSSTYLQFLSDNSLSSYEKIGDSPLYDKINSSVLSDTITLSANNEHCLKKLT